MRIVIVSHGLSQGGAERVAAILANGLSLQHEVLFLAAYSGDREYELRDEVKYRYISAPSSNRIMKFLARNHDVYREIRDFDAELVISFITNEVLYTNLLNVPMIYSPRNDPRRLFKSIPKKIISKISYGRARAIVFQTRDARDYFPERIRKKGEIIGNPLSDDMPFWKDFVHKKTIITACRLDKQKNLPLMLHGFSKFHTLYPEYRLEIYGQGEELEPLQKLTGELGLAEAVSFGGHSTDIFQIMAKSGIFTLTSDYEGLSNSMLEALAIGVPTVCTDCPIGGASEYIEDGVNGYLIPVGDEEALVQKWTLLADDAGLCHRMSDNAIRIRQTLGKENILRKWQTVIDRSMS